MKTVKIDCSSIDGQLWFSLYFTTVEWADLLQFVENGLKWPRSSEWLDGIKKGIMCLTSGYFDNKYFVVCASIVK